MLNILKFLKIIINHPLNVNNKFESLLRFFSFNLKKILKKKIIFSWVEESKLIYDNTKIEKLSQRQIKLNYYLGMAEYKDMIFLIHCLKLLILETYNILLEHLRKFYLVLKFVCLLSLLFYVNFLTC